MPDNERRASPIDGDNLRDGIGLALSGGGYRAMVFHAGAIFRLNELGLLPRLDRISSVSGGSMTAAALAVAWRDLQFDANGVAANLRAEFLVPILRQAEDSIDVGSAFGGLLPFVSAADIAAKSYRHNLTGDTELSSLPANPTFVFNATNLMTGATTRFRSDFVADYQIGVIEGLRLKLSDVVACSAAFPPVLSPATIDLSGGTVRPGTQGPHARPPFLGRVAFTDGGVYDNLGSETIWKLYRTLLISNAGKPFAFDEGPAHDWLGQSLRVLDIALDQSEDLRERILAHAYEVAARNGAMWGLTTGLSKPEDRPQMLSEAEYMAAQAVPTRLVRLSRGDQNLLLKAGYAHAASRIRKYFVPERGGPEDLPDGQPPQV